MKVSDNHSVSTAVRHFSLQTDKSIDESTMRTFKNGYYQKLKTQSTDNIEWQLKTWSGNDFQRVWRQSINKMYISGQFRAIPDILVTATPATVSNDILIIGWIWSERHYYTTRSRISQMVIRSMQLDEANITAAVNARIYINRYVNA